MLKSSDLITNFSLFLFVSPSCSEKQKTCVFGYYIISLVLYIAQHQIHNRIIFVPCAALTNDVGRRMHEESHTQTSDLDNNSRDDICECFFILSRHIIHYIHYTFLKYDCCTYPAKAILHLPHVYILIRNINLI